MLHLGIPRRSILRAVCFGLPASLVMAQGAWAGSDTKKPEGGVDMSGSEISWVFSVTVKADAGDKLKALIEKMADQAKASEPGTLGYEWSISDDGTHAQVHEHYRDSDAALSHLASFNANFAEPLMELVTPTGMIVFGNPSSELRQTIADAKPIYMQPAGGFVR